MKKIQAILTAVKKGCYFELLLKVSANLVPQWLILPGKTNIVAFEGSCIYLKRKVKNVVFRQASSEDLHELLSCSNYNPKTDNLKELFSSYFSNNHLCFCLEYNDEIVGYAWAFLNNYTITFDRYHRSNVLIRFQEHTVFLGDGFINSRYRLKGFFPVLLSGVVDNLHRDYQITKFLGHIDTSNDLSFKSHLRLGFSHISTLYYVNILWMNYISLVDFVHPGQNQKVFRRHKSASLKNKEADLEI
ncbi:MAG: GNAT family N-acetyltransferase [Proteobacteria bacterium]|nr:GNAT family N-acetyltransferase [Pseudomonadota bacterium]